MKNYQFKIIHFVGIVFCLCRASPSVWIDSPCVNSNYLKFVRVNYHFILDENGGGNFSSTSDGLNGCSGLMNGTNYARKMVEKANEQLAQNQKLWLPSGNKIPQLPTRIQYVLDSVYFHKNTVWHLHKHQMNDFSLHQTYGQKKTSVINIYDIGQKPVNFSEGITSPRKRAIKLFFPYQDLQKSVQNSNYNLDAYLNRMARLLNHEMGHVFGLQHTWSFWFFDGCDDTPTHNNCWEFNLKNSNCDTWEEISNNIMDYNPHVAFSPCQIEKIHQNLNGINRHYIKKCEVCKN